MLSMFQPLRSAKDATSLGRGGRYRRFDPTRRWLLRCPAPHPLPIRARHVSPRPAPPHLNVPLESPFPLLPLFQFTRTHPHRIARPQSAIHTNPSIAPPARIPVESELPEARGSPNRLPIRARRK
ncbi:hypothetical protein U9M48_025556 [Paspalum notatum var. saurae]|uniref:Uncharacterized protein n=1 Tax=Paspalum notatum var. saurae TaxID=547442 RepID=A0AAQ3WYF8_PASNO